MTCCHQIGMGDVSNSESRPVFDGIIVRHCDVCYLLDGNTQPKEVRYCKLCDAFMCEPCRTSMFRRTLAKFSRTFSKRLKGQTV
jgi:hypothetical protein